MTTNTEILGLSLAVVAFVMLYVARRGRRIDEHPLCRRCGFDLTGTPEGSAQCSECGASLSQKRAVIRGHRKPFAKWSAISVMLVVVSLFWLVYAGYRRFEAIDWIRYRTTSWLIQRIEVGDGPGCDEASIELQRRVDAGLLKPADEEALVNTALAHHQDRVAPWRPVWSRLIERVHTAQRLPEAKLNRYLAQSVQFRVARVISRKSEVEFRIERIADRLAPNSVLPGEYSGMLYAKDEFPGSWGKTVPGNVEHPWAGQSGAYKADWHDMPEEAGYQRICFLPATPDNPHVVGSLRWISARPEQTPSPGQWKFKVPLMLVGPHRCEFDLEVPFTFYGEAEKITTADLAQPVRQSIRITGVKLAIGRQEYNDVVTVDMVIDRPPIDVGFDVYAWDGKAFEPTFSSTVQGIAGETAHCRYQVLCGTSRNPKTIFPLRLKLVPGEAPPASRRVWNAPVEITIRGDEGGQQLIEQ